MCSPFVLFKKDCHKYQVYIYISIHLAFRAVLIEKDSLTLILSTILPIENFSCAAVPSQCCNCRTNFGSALAEHDLVCSCNYFGSPSEKDKRTLMN